MRGRGGGVHTSSLRVPTPIFSNKLRTQALRVYSMHFLFDNDAPHAQLAHGTCVVALALAPPPGSLTSP